jgi:hypothetical protein
MNIEKIAIVVWSELPVWQKLNVTSFLSSAVAIAIPATHGAEFKDAQGNAYLPFLKYPILIYKAESKAQIKRAFDRARDRELKLGIYVEELFATKNEEQNHAVIGQQQTNDLNMLGIIVFGDGKKVDKTFDGLKLHE